MAPSASPGILMRAHSGATYRFDPGALCLELLTTGGPGEFRRYEVLHAPGDLAAWAGRSRLTPTPDLEVTDAEVVDARRLRDALFRVTTARALGETPAPADLDTINEAAAHPPLVPSVGPDGERRWAGAADGTGLLSTVARDGVDLLTGPFAHRIRRCASDNCYLIYVDTSRPGRRRWCSMEHCGNLHKVRTLRARRADEG
ncbi:CGNR zinc finger domain-containing protein [Streptomyces sp. NRRL S-920]|uniref:CGNR zinc finger domain-containing protein n=1 Tax=Streptomyces sp. NRRL S-920 TaxID=1463921 RepID=UPI0004CB1029|nr:CGNR zinc finger domain-containing protein [Streptomyces sp. NRRL S-920]